MPVPNPPRAARAVAGNKAILVSWASPAGGPKPMSYFVRCFLSPDRTFVKQYGTTHLSQKFDGLVNGVDYEFDLTAINAVGSSSTVHVGPRQPVAPSAALVHLTMTKIAPDKVANTRPGQSLADAPTLVVTGTNLAQPWGVDPRHVLEWVLYTDLGHGTVVGVDTVSVLVTQDVATSMKITSPVAPGGADVDSNHLIGPWRLKATYVPDPASPDATAVVYSPDFYTTAVGTVIIGTASPNPMHDGDIVTVTGPDVGVCTTAIVTIGGVTVDTPLTRIDQNSASFVCPTYGFQLPASGEITLEYALNGNVLATPPFTVNWDAVAAGTGGETTYVPPTGVDIPSGDMAYPVIVQRWVFTNPSTGETYTVPRNPDAMTSPFPSRTINAKHSTAITGQVLLTEGAPQLAANWQFSGTMADSRHYEKLRHWVNDINNRVQITDHYGRVIDCVLLNFDPKPKRDMHRYWSHTYTITALVIRVGEPTQVPA